MSTHANIMQSVSVQQVQACAYLVIFALGSARQLTDSDNDEALELEVHLLSFLAARMRLHHLPLVVLGSGRATLADKFSCLMHGFLLEAGGDCESLIQYCSEVRVITTDFGTEYGLSRVGAVSINNLFPWISGKQVEAVECGLDDDGFDPVELQDPHLNHPVSLEEAIPVPGILHILHNASNSLTDSLKCLDACVGQLSVVAKFLAQPFTRDRLLETVSTVRSASCCMVRSKISIAK